MLFNDLPVDVKRAIIDFIVRPTDLKTLCLTSKDLREASTPALYKDLTLRVGGSQDLRLTAMLHPQNSGLKHVRHIDLRLEKWTKPKQSSADSDESSSDEGELVEECVSAKFAQLTVKMLLDYLPRDVLESFTWHPWEPISCENYCLLLEKQKKLQYLELGPIDRHLHPELEKRPQLYEGFSDLKQLDLYPDNVDSLKTAAKFLTNYPKISSFSLMPVFEYNRKESTPDDLFDSSTQVGVISRTLFAHLMPFDSGRSVTLKTLILHDVNVRYPSDTWLKVVKFANLEKLELRECVGVDALFSRLSKPHLRPTRLKTLRWMDDRYSESHTLEAFEGFLEGISTLENLNIWLSRMENLPKVEAITRQRQTLKTLAVYSRRSGYDIHVYSEESFNRLCTECQNICQLSVNFPDMYVSDAFSAEFQIYLDILHKLRNLVTLNIRSWPSPRESFEGSLKEAERQLRFYEHDLQRLSQLIFESADANAAENGHGLGHRSRLSVVAWGAPGQSSRNSHDMHSLMQIPFVRGTITDPFGKSSLHAVNTTWRLAEYLEPESTILQQSLYGLHDPEYGIVPRKRR